MAEDEINKIFQDFLAAHVDDVNIDFAPLLTAHPDLGERLTQKVAAYKRASHVLEPDKSPTSSAIDDPLIGKTIGGCKIKNLIRRGGMGAVYFAKQESLNRDVALKILHQSVTSSESSFGRFRRESQNIAKLDHENILPVYDVGSQDGIHYVITKYVSGVSLEDIIRIYREKNAPPTLDDITKLLGSDLTQWKYHPKDYLDFVYHIITKTAEALAFTHSRGIIHRDVKPSNILLKDDGEPVLIDFGLSRDYAQSTITMTGEYMGTPVYSAPEQLFGLQADVDERADIYSLGMTFYELATGRLPFDGKTFLDVVTNIKSQLPKNPREYCSELGENFCQIILKAIEKDRNKRFSSVGEIANLFSNTVTPDKISTPKEKREIKNNNDTRAIPSGKRSTSIFLKAIKFFFGIIMATLIISIFIKNNNTNNRWTSNFLKALLTDEGSGRKKPIYLGVSPKNTKEDVESMIVGTWTGHYSLSGGVTAWIKMKIYSSKTIDMYQAIASDDFWGEPIKYTWNATSGKYSNTGEQWYGIDIGFDYPIEVKDGSLWIRLPDEDGYYFNDLIELTRGDNSPLEESSKENSNTSSNNHDISSTSTTSKQNNNKTVSESNLQNPDTTDFILPNSDKRQLGDDDLKDLSTDQFAFARNEIFARHGYVFGDGEKSKKYKDYFEAKSWYRPDPDYDGSINEIEKYNVELIRKYEQSETVLSDFNRYPDNSVFSGKTAPPELDETYDGRIQFYINEALAKGPNFDGSYSVVQIGCGTSCTFSLVIDNNTGKIFNFPLGGEANPRLQLKYQIDSRLIIAQWENEKKCMRTYYDWSDEIFFKIKEVEIGDRNACN